MTLTYIVHSGFALETAQCIIVFDYWFDPTHVMDRLLQSAKPIYVLASHFHEDHFTRSIFDWRLRKSNITYLLSKDILKHRRAQREEADAWLAKGASWQDNIITVHATGSTDSGVSWIIKTEGKLIFHAGDLNNWYARFLTDSYSGGIIRSTEMDTDVDPEKEEKRYLGELKDIAKITTHFDIAMFPIDGRIGNGYTRGARQFIKCFSVKLLVPMHFLASGFQSAARMQDFADTAKTAFWAIRHEGESITV